MENERLIYDYHCFNAWRMFETSKEKKEGGAKYYIGFELEIENNDGDCYDLQEVHDLITSNINSVLMHDGSLNYGGIEIVSHPQSIKYIKAQKQKYTNLFNTLIDYNFTSHDNGHCGLHFHFTRPQDESVIDRIILIMETFKEEIFKYSRRQDNQWCKFITDERGDQDYIKSLYYIKKDKANHDRYMALNLRNAKTIEFRVMRGTLNYNTFMASLELCDNIYNIALSDKDINTITWQDLTATKYAKEYTITRGITSTKQVKDNSDIIIEIEKNAMQRRAQIDAIIKKVIRKLKSEIKDNYYDHVISLKLTGNINEIANIREIENKLYGILARYDANYSGINNLKAYLKRNVETIDDLKRYIYQTHDAFSYSYNKYISKKDRDLFNVIYNEVMAICV